MNAMKKALDEIKFNIPLEILQIAFIENGNRVNHITSIDEKISSIVLRPRVMIDCNLVGGVDIKIPVNKCTWWETSFPYEYIIEVPKTMTNGRSIVNIYSMIANLGYMNTAPIENQVSPLLNATANMFNNLTNVNIVQTARLELIGENTILVQDPSVYIFNCILRCKIENEKNMNNLHPSYFGEFAKLCVLAVKSYVYNFLKVKLDQSYIYGGHELSVITDLVDGYADAEEMYQEQLKVFMKIAFMNNGNTMDRYIKSMFGNTI